MDALRARMKDRKLTYGDLAAAVGRSALYVAAVLQGQQRLDPPEAEKLAAVLGLGPDAATALAAFPVRSEFPLTTDPFWRSSASTGTRSARWGTRCSGTAS